MKNNLISGYDVFWTILKEIMNKNVDDGFNISMLKPLYYGIYDKIRQDVILSYGNFKQTVFENIFQMKTIRQSNTFLNKTWN